MKEIIQKITLLVAVALVAIAGTVAVSHLSGNSAKVSAQPDSWLEASPSIFGA